MNCIELVGDLIRDQLHFQPQVPCLADVPNSVSDATWQRVVDRVDPCGWWTVATALLVAEWSCNEL